MELLHRLSGYVAVLLEIEKYGLGYGGMLGCRCAAELVEADAEPFVNIPVHGVETVAEFPGADALFLGLGFGRCPVFVGPADVERVIASQPAKSGENIGRKHLDEVAEVGHVIHIGQGGSDKSAFHISAQYPCCQGGVKNAAA